MVVLPRRYRSISHAEAILPDVAGEHGMVIVKLLTEGLYTDPRKRASTSQLMGTVSIKRTHRGHGARCRLCYIGANTSLVNTLYESALDSPPASWSTGYTDGPRLDLERSAQAASSDLQAPLARPQQTARSGYDQPHAQPTSSRLGSGQRCSICRVSASMSAPVNAAPMPSRCTAR